MLTSLHNCPHVFKSFQHPYLYLHPHLYPYAYLLRLHPHSPLRKHLRYFLLEQQLPLLQQRLPLPLRRSLPLILSR